VGSRRGLVVAVSAVSCFGTVGGIASGNDAPLPAGVRAVWDLGKAYRDATA
jgi:hypothetical protein